MTATVTDAETPVNQLTYEWSSSVGGTFGSNAATTTWTAPATLTGTTPVNATLTLTVTERVDATRNNRVTATTVVDLHNSAKEVGDLACQFLEDFSKQLPPDNVMRNFTNNCPDAADERQDVVNQQKAVQMIAYELGMPSTTVPFTGYVRSANVSAMRAPTCRLDGRPIDKSDRAMSGLPAASIR